MLSTESTANISAVFLTVEINHFDQAHRMEFHEESDDASSPNDSREETPCPPGQSLHKNELSIEVNQNRMEMEHECAVDDEDQNPRDGNESRGEGSKENDGS